MPKTGFLPSSSLQRVVQVADRRGVARPVREEDAVGLERQDLLGGGGRRNDGDVAAALGEPAQDVVLDARVHRDDAVARRDRQDAGVDRAARSRAAPRSPTGTRSTAATSATRSLPTSPGEAAARATSDAPSRLDRGDDRAHRAALAQVPREAPGVDAGDRHDTPRLEEGGQRLLGAPARRLVAHLAHDEALREHAARLHVGAVDAVVADVRHRHRDDLAGVARVGQDLLVAGHRGVEAQLAGGLAVRTARDAGKDGAVLERQKRGAHEPPSRPPFRCAGRTAPRPGPRSPCRVV